MAYICACSVFTLTSSATVSLWPQAEGGTVDQVSRAGLSPASALNPHDPEQAI